MSYCRAVAILIALAGSMSAGIAADAPRLDSCGDPVPEGARARLGTVRLRHGGWHLSALFAHDSRALWTGNEDGVARLWDVATAKALRALVTGDHGLRGLALSPDGRTLATGGYQGVDLWDLATGTVRRHLKAGRVRSLAFAPDGKTLVSGGSDGDASLRVWDVAAGAERRRMRWHEREVIAVRIAPDNRTLVSVSNHGHRVHLADLETGDEIRVLSGHAWNLYDATVLTPDCKTLILAQLDNEDETRKSTAAVLNPLTGERIGAMDIGRNYVTGAALTPDGKTLLTSDRDSGVHVWDLAGGSEVGHWNVLRSAVVQVSPDGRLVLLKTGSALQLYDIKSGRLLNDTSAGHFGYVSSLSFSPDGNTLASCSYEENTVRLWDVAGLRPLRILPGHQGRQAYVRSVQFLPAGLGVISGGSDSRLRLWDPGDGREVRAFRLSGEEQVSVMQVSGDGRRVLCRSMGFEHDSPAVDTGFDIATGEMIGRREQKRDAWKSFDWPTFAPDCVRLVEPDDDGLALRSWPGGKVQMRFRGNAYLRSSAFSADGKTLATISSVAMQEGNRQFHGDYHVRLFDAASGQEKLAIPAQDWAQLCTFSADGRRLALVEGMTIRIYAVATGRELWHSPAQASRIHALAFAPDGRTLAAGMGDTGILLWDVPERDSDR